MNTIRPLRSRSMPFAARLATRNDPVRLVSITLDQSSSVIRSSSVSRVMPALATSTSTGPCAASISANAASTCSGSVTSHLTPRNPSGASPLRYVTATSSPAATKLAAIAAPIPRFPPVTSTDLPTLSSVHRALVTRRVVVRRAVVARPGRRPERYRRTNRYDERDPPIGAHLTPGTTTRRAPQPPVPWSQGTDERRHAGSEGPDEWSEGSGVFEAEADLHAYLDVVDLVVLDVAADLGDLEPVEVPQGLAGAAQAVADGG